MASNANTDADKLIAFGKMALEQGWYDQAREYFEQALALDASNREATKGLARVNEVFRRKEAAGVEATQGESVEPPHRVVRKRRVPEKETKEQGRSPIQWFKRQSGLGKIAILAGVPLLFLLCAGLANMINPAPEATPTVVPTATLAPTPTTVRLAPTATPGLSAEEEAYLLQVAEINQDSLDTMKDLRTLMTGAAPKSLLIMDNDWKLEVAVHLATWRVCGQRLRGLNAPVRFKDVHQDLVQASRHYDRSAALIAEGIDEVNVDKIYQSTDELLLGAEYVDRATRKIEELQR